MEQNLSITGKIWNVDENVSDISATDDFLMQLLSKRGISNLSGNFGMLFHYRRGGLSSESYGTGCRGI